MAEPYPHEEDVKMRNAILSLGFVLQLHSPARPAQVTLTGPKSMQFLAKPRAFRATYIATASRAATCK